ncbi:MAG TPA: hypothetical protein VHW23_40410 [Kofleriaceae bacterium]|jgi:hypothetical protein|nr:hypothetical protein [Kofleriaceae bacterium]
MRTWIIGVGIALLSACAVEPTAPSPPEATSSSELTLSSDGVTPLAACTPGSVRLCCPFPQGCSCPGTQDCDSTGNWGFCEGAGPRGKPCP